MAHENSKFICGLLSTALLAGCVGPEQTAEIKEPPSAMMMQISNAVDKVLAPLIEEAPASTAAQETPKDVPLSLSTPLLAQEKITQGEFITEATGIAAPTIRLLSEANYTDVAITSSFLNAENIVACTVANSYLNLLSPVGGHIGIGFSATDPKGHAVEGTVCLNEKPSAEKPSTQKAKVVIRKDKGFAMS